MTITPVIVPVPGNIRVRTREQVAQQRDCARAALLHCAAHCGAPLTGWEKSDDGVPLPCEGFHWSISHKPRWAAAVIAPEPVGIDIEQLTPRTQRLFDEIADDQEWALLGRRTWRKFYRLWTAKEAVLKAVGVGVAGLDRCRLVHCSDADHMVLEYEGKEWHVAHFEKADFVAAVTCGRHPVEWCFLQRLPSSIGTVGSPTSADAHVASACPSPSAASL